MVIDDADEALRLVAAGCNVVLVFAEGILPPAAPTAAGAGRMAVLVGDPHDPDTRAAAEAMDAELFGTSS